MTDRYAVFGNPVAHSKSPRIHALFAAQTGEDIHYEAILAPLDDFAGTLRAFALAGGCGGNVTLPFKEEAFRLCEQRTARAEAAGAVNTLIIEHDDDVFHFVGDNTDGAGLVRDIEHNLGFQIAGKRVLLLGAGGAAHGVIGPLDDSSPMQLVIANRTKSKAGALVEKHSSSSVGKLPKKHKKQKAPTSVAGFRSSTVNAFDFYELQGQSFDLIINATSAGLADAALPLPDEIFAPGCLAYDMLYGRETPFMRQAAAAGANVADGLGMLIEQAAESFAVWRGVRPQTEPVLKLMRAS